MSSANREEVSLLTCQRVAGMESNDKKEIVSVDSEDTSMSKQKLLVSILVVLGIAVSYVCACQFGQYALIIDPTTFHAPYFMLWMNTTWMVLCFPVFLLYNRCRELSVQQGYRQSLPVYGGSFARGFGRVLLFLVLWTGSNYMLLLSLTKVSASVSTSISSCNAALVWLLSMLLLGDKFSVPKLIAVIFAICGVVMMSLDGQLSAAWAGILMAVASAVFGAVYTTLFKYVLGSAKLGEVSLFLTSLGLLNLVLNAVPTLILNLTGVEFVNLSKLPWLPLVGSAALGLLMNFLINFGIALLHPLVIAVGVLLGLPLNTAVDIVLVKVSFSVLFLCGSIAVIISFVLVIFPYSLVPSCRRIGAA